MPAKKIAKQDKIKAKNANSRSVSKQPSKSLPKSAPKNTKTKKSTPKVDTKKSAPKTKNVIVTKSPLKPAVNSAAKSAKKDTRALSKEQNKKFSSPIKVVSTVTIPTVDIKKSEQKIVKAITKGGAAVDSLVPNSQQYRVFADSTRIYSATLNQANLMENNNKFYIIQILQQQGTSQIFNWNRWGRVGTPGMNAFKGPFDKNRAISQFKTKHNEKTLKGDYKQIQIKYEDDQEKKPQVKEVKKGPKKQIKSCMNQDLQRFISLIFDVNVMNNTMKEIGYDAKKMPLGKLGDNTIKQAYKILNGLLEAIKNNNKNDLFKLSGDFYTLIPHDFGFQKMSNFVLNNEQKVKQKLKMLEMISDMKITTKLLEQSSNDQMAILDQNYKKLGCEIKSLEKASNDYQLLNEYFNNTKGQFNKVQIGDIFEVVRPDEQSRYNQKIGNNILLWHGSRLSNFVGILSQGLRIAPPQAPVSGYLFGKGIYLADMAEKSIHYCRSYGCDNALILLIEGAIGDPNVLLASSHSAKEEMMKNKKDSTKCHGSKAPPEESYVKLKSMSVPKGVPKPTGSGSYMGHNEFIVYNMNQARIRYVLRMDMKGC